MKKNQTENIIELKGIKKGFDGETVVENIDLTVKRGEFVTILGPSGCGKTTTLRMIAGFEIPDEGEILLDGKDISSLPPYMRSVNTVFQRYALFPHLNVYDNIAFGLKLKKMDKEEIVAKVKHVLDVVDMEDFEKRKVSTLSGGQQQRIAIARAIVNEPEILLLDEPLGALDLKMRKEMQIELKAMHEELGMTFIYVTHDQEEALTMSDKIVVMANGHIKQIGTPEEIYNEPADAFVADFIGESNIFNGKMTGMLKVKFCGAEFECLDNYPKDTLIDVVVRPEDVILVGENEGIINGEVISVVFKGMHYEVTIQSGKNEIVCQRTRAAAVGEKVGIIIEPDGIHCMISGEVVNRYQGVISRRHTVSFIDSEFECDLTMLYPGSVLKDDGNIVKADGTVVDPVGLNVLVEMPVEKLSMSDDANAGGACGNIISLIYKGDHYNYVVKTKNGIEYMLDDEYLWNENDYVSILCDKKDIKISLPEKEE